MGRLRRLKILVDGATAAKLLPNQTATLTLPPGSHTFRASMDWIRSAPITAVVSATEELVLAASVPVGGALGLFTGGGPPTIEVRQGHQQPDKSSH